jgi:hypothetical protein
VILDPAGVDEVIKAAAAESAALLLFRRVSMGTKHSALPVLSALAQAYFVAGDTGLKETTEMAWAGITLEAEELAAFVPVPEAVVDDSDFDLWGEVSRGSPRPSGSRSTLPCSRAQTSSRRGRRRTCPPRSRQPTRPSRAVDRRAGRHRRVRSPHAKRRASSLRSRDICCKHSMLKHDRIRHDGLAGRSRDRAGHPDNAESG